LLLSLLLILWNWGVGQNPYEEMTKA
jgi:hypothetical protein